MTRRNLTTVALVALAIAGCGETPAEPTQATATAAVTFSQCMRENGVSEFPDPEASGELTIDGVLNGSSLDADSPAWKQAISACKDLQPSGFTGRTRTGAEDDAALVFAQCIRDHGVKDFPDPAEGEPLVDTNRIPSAATDRGMAVLNAAMQACRGAGETAGARP